MKIKFILVVFLALICTVINAMDVEPHHNVTVHLMWVNKTKQPHIVPREIIRNYTKDENKGEMQDLPEWLRIYQQKPTKIQTINSINRILGWAQYYSVIVWYDSKYVDNLDKDLAAIKAEIEKLHPSHPITFVDIRTLKTVEECGDLFDDKFTLYFRTDLLRVLAAVEYLYGYIPLSAKLTVSHEPLKHWSQTNYVVYADWSVEPMDYKVLMDENTKSNLENYGMVMASKSNYGYENNFQIISSNNPSLYYAVYYALIKLNVERARNALLKTTGRPDLDHAIYYSYRGLFALYQHLKNMGTMTYDHKEIVARSLGSELFEFLDQHLLSCFGEVTYMPDGCRCAFIPDKGFKYDDKLWGRDYHMYVPITRKPGYFQESQFG